MIIISDLCNTDTCTLKFENPDNLHKFKVVIQPDEGYWRNGHFTFEIIVPPEYNIKPPSVTCLTRLWHPNINETGEVCLRYSLNR